MTTLFAISVAAFLALMWASISTARHIRRTRRRRTAARTLPPFSPEVARAAEALAAGSWGRAARPDWKADSPNAESQSVSAPPAKSLPAGAPEPTRSNLPRPVEVVVAPVIETVPDPQPRPVDPPALPEIRFPLSSQRRASSAALAVALEAISAQPSTSPNPEAADTPAPPAAQRNHGSSASHAATNFQLRRPPAPASDSRIDWAYFNKDMGDLRDPEPRFRERPRQR